MPTFISFHPYSYQKLLLIDGINNVKCSSFATFSCFELKLWIELSRTISKNYFPVEFKLVSTSRSRIGRSITMCYINCRAKMSYSLPSLAVGGL